MPGSERSTTGGYGGARTYTLTYRGSDVAGNTAECKATVTVPKGG